MDYLSRNSEVITMPKKEFLPKRSKIECDKNIHLEKYTRYNATKGAFHITWNCRKEVLDNVSHRLSNENEQEFAHKIKWPGIPREQHYG